MNDEPRDGSWPDLVVEEEVVRSMGDEMAVAVGLTHDVSPAVSQFVREELPHVGRILHCRPDGGPSQHFVRCGEHAWQLAEKTVAAVGTQRGHLGATSALHLFIAGPNEVRVLSRSTTHPWSGIRVRVGLRGRARRWLRVGDFRIANERVWECGGVQLRKRRTSTWLGD